MERMIEAGWASLPPAKPQKAPTRATIRKARPMNSQSADFEAESVPAARIDVER
jgi:hypothetical protein